MWPGTELPSSKPKLVLGSAVRPAAGSSLRGEPPIRYRSWIGSHLRPGTQTKKAHLREPFSFAWPGTELPSSKPKLVLGSAVRPAAGSSLRGEPPIRYRSWIGSHLRPGTQTKKAHLREPFSFAWPGTELNRRHGDFQSRCRSL